MITTDGGENGTDRIWRPNIISGQVIQRKLQRLNLLKKYSGGVVK
jgi:hypothetical protein